MTGNPYDEYVEQKLSEINFEKTWYGDGPIEDWTTIRRTELESLLADAWLSGLAYSLNLVEGEKEKRSAP